MESKLNKSRLNALLVGLGLGGGLLFAVIYIVISVYFAVNAINENGSGVINLQ